MRNIYSRCNLKFDDYLKEEIKLNNFNGFLDKDDISIAEKQYFYWLKKARCSGTNVWVCNWDVFQSDDLCDNEGNTVDVQCGDPQCFRRTKKFDEEIKELKDMYGVIYTPKELTGVYLLDITRMTRCYYNPLYKNTIEEVKNNHKKEEQECKNKESSIGIGRFGESVECGVKQNIDGKIPMSNDEIIKILKSLYLSRNIVEYGENNYKIISQKEKSVDLLKLYYTSNTFEEHGLKTGDRAVSILELGGFKEKFLQFFEERSIKDKTYQKVPSKAIIIKVYKDNEENPNFCFYPDKSFTEKYGGYIASGVIEVSAFALGGPAAERAAAFIMGTGLYLWEYHVDKKKKWPKGIGDEVRTLEDLNMK